MTKKETIKAIIQQQIDDNPQLKKKPLFLHCAVRWDDEDDVDTENYSEPSKGYDDVKICVVDKDDYVAHEYGSKYPFDEEVFYYIHDITELLELVEYDNGSEFHIVGYFYSELVK